MKLQRLKPRVTLTGNRLPSAAEHHRTKRLRGSALQARNRRLLQKNPICVDCAQLGEIKAREAGYTITVDEWDHVIPLVKGGVDDETNLAGRCLQHHREKSERERIERQNGSV